MNDSSQPESPPSSRLNMVIAQYRQRLEQGEAVDGQELLDELSKIADESRADSTMQWDATVLHRSDRPGGDSADSHAAGEPPTIEHVSEAEPRTQSLQRALEREASTGGETVTDFKRSPRPAADLLNLDDYEVIEEIARGGMGIVFKARQISLNRLVAVKIMLAGSLADAAEVERFHGEATAAGRLKHPNIVAIHEVGQAGPRGDQHFFSMDYVEGRSLAAVVREHPLAPRQTARYVAKIARAIHFAHEHKILHRDLKPSNILIDGDDEPQVTDFGLAKHIEGDSNLTASGSVLGTPSYMPPEQASGRSGEMGPHSDVYSLGAVLYESLTGRPPFRAETPVDTLMQVITDEPVPPARLQPKVPADLDTICLKCLQKDSRKRYPTALALAEDLERFLNNEPIAARPVGTVERAVKWCRRHPALAALCVVLLIGMAGALGGFVWHSASMTAKNAALNYANTQIRNALGDAKLKSSQLRRNLYNVEMAKALEHFLAGRPNVSRTIELLDAHIPKEGETDLRGFEWYYLYRLCNSHEAQFTGSTNGVAFLIHLEDGRLLAGYQSTHVSEPYVELRQGTRLLRQFAIESETGDLISGAVHEASNTLALGWSNGDVSLHDLDKPYPPRMRFHAHPGQQDTEVALSPAGDLVASGATAGDVKLWDVATGELRATLEGHANRVMRLAFSPDGRFLASGSRQVVMHDVKSGEIAYTISDNRSVVADLAFSPNGRYLATIDMNDRLFIWITAQGKEALRHNFMDDAGPTRLSYSPDGKRIAVGTDGATVHVFETTRNFAQTFRGHVHRITALSFERDGKTLVSGSGQGVVKVWNVDRAQLGYALGPQNFAPGFIRFAPDGRRLAYCRGMAPNPDDAELDDAELLIYDYKTGEMQLRLAGYFSFCVFTPDGKTLITGRATPAEVDLPDEDLPEEPEKKLPGGLELWDLATGQRAGKIELPGCRVYCAEFAGPGTLVCGCDDGRIRLWNMQSGQVDAELPGHDGWIQTMQISRDGRRLATQGGDMDIRVWDVPGQRQLVRSRGHVLSNTLAISPDGKLAAWPSADPVAAIGDARERLDAQTARVLGTATNQRFDHHVELVQPLDGKLVRVLAGHRGGVKSVAFSPIEPRVATGGEDGTLKMWDLDTGEQLLSLPVGPLDVLQIAFSPDGQALATIGLDGFLRVWLAPRDIELPNQ